MTAQAGEERDSKQWLRCRSRSADRCADSSWSSSNETRARALSQSLRPTEGFDDGRYGELEGTPCRIDQRTEQHEPDTE